MKIKLPKKKLCIRCARRRQWKNLYCKPCFRQLAQSHNN